METYAIPRSSGHGAGYGRQPSPECCHCRYSEREGDALMCRLNPKLRRYANQWCEAWEREPGIEG